jgi:hypothetical protein
MRKKAKALTRKAVKMHRKAVMFSKAAKCILFQLEK